MPRPRLSFLLAALAFVIAGWPAAQVASATPSAEYLGVNVQPLMKDTTIPESSWNNYLGPLQNGQLTVVRHDINWFLAEPTAPVNGVDTYNWNNQTVSLRRSIDYQMVQLASHGIRVAPSFTGLPTWAQQAQAKNPESWFQSFAQFVASFAVRYGPGGAFWSEYPQLPYLPVTDLEIWNEANSANSWTGKPDAAGYGRMLATVYPIVKSAQPNAVIEASIGWPDANSFLDGIFAAGGGSSFDTIAFHPYAPIATSIIDLVTSMRTHVGVLGRGDIPINVTETGEPVALAPPYSAHAYAGGVSDAARAATQTFTADALAHSDCNVNQFLVYAITGSETNREIISEGFMGIERYADGSMNTTGQSLSRAAARWIAAVKNGTAVKNGLLGLCSGNATPPAALLPLGLSAKPSSKNCVTGSVDYDGNPLEGSTLVMVTPDGRRATTQPDAFGNSDVCVPNGPVVKTVQVYAEVPNAAKSAVLTCDVPILTSCAVAPVATAAAAPPVCTVTFPKVNPKKVTIGKKSKTRITSLLHCPTYKSTYIAKVKTKVKVKGKKTKAGKPVYKTVIKKVTKQVRPVFTVYVHPPTALDKKGKPKKKQPKNIKIRTLVLTHDKKTTFTFNRALKKGETIVLLHALKPKKDKLPLVRVTVPLKLEKAKKTTKKAAKR